MTESDTRRLVAGGTVTGRQERPDGVPLWLGIIVTLLVYGLAGILAAAVGGW